MIKIELTPPAINSLSEGLRREWLETNGVGGWASSTVAGANTRRYHGLLVAATKPPVGRMVLVSKLEETVLLESAPIELGCNQYPGLVHPVGYRYLTRCSRGIFPEFEYSLNNNEIRIRKTISAICGENTTVVHYELLRGPQALTLQFTPFIAARDYHSLTRENNTLNRAFEFNEGTLSVEPYKGVPRFFIYVPGGKFTESSAWYYNFEYAIEQERGLDYREDLFSYGRITAELTAARPISIILSTVNPSGRNGVALVRAERERREKIVQLCKVQDDLARSLTLASDQFIVSRDADLKTLIAGYHWFTDWGRDTMISLPGACLITGRFEDAKRILRAFAGSISQGMLPNRFPDSGEEPEYNTVDATLWFFVAVAKYLEYTGDEQFVRDELLSSLQEILAWHQQGTRYNIHIDEDGLLSAGTPGQQLTWMDAKVGDWVVTPRHGQPVEVNALLYNALAITAELLERFDHHSEAQTLSQRARKLKESFNANFWNDRLGCLFDYINGDYQDQAVRPNQIFALSLPFPLLSDDRARRVLQIVRERLLTPYGLRSLDPSHSEYKGVCKGDPRTRDAAYHQGTVWAWLLGPYITAACRYETTGREESRALIQNMVNHLSDAGLGTISEVFDGDAPHEPRGCIAQCWSVAELLRAYVEDVLKVDGATLT